MNNSESNCYLSKGSLKNYPSAVDILLYVFTFLSPIIFFFPWDSNQIQSLFFVFGSFLLLGLSFSVEREKEYKNWVLVFLIFWSLISIFLHSFKNDLIGTYMERFISFSVMSEGFVYVLSACIIFYLCVSYSRNFKIEYPLLAINILNLLFASTQKMGIYLIFDNIVQSSQSSICGLLGTKSQLAVFSAVSAPILYGLFKPLALIPFINLLLSNSYTALGALFLGVLIYCFVKKHYRFLFLMSIIGVLLMFCIDWYKFYIRPHAWLYSLREISISPVFGHGFDTSINMNKIIIPIDGKSEFVFRHNDYLNIARDLGIPFLSVVLFGIYRIVSKVKFDMVSLSIVILMICCFIQTSFYFPRIAVIGILLLAIKERERIHG